MDDRASTESETPQPPPKKPYKKPELVRLGGLRDVTKSTGLLGQVDGGRLLLRTRTGL